MPRDKRADAGTVYSSAKAAVRYSVKGWAAELIGKGIRVNNFSPGVADTPILDSQHEGNGSREITGIKAFSEPLQRGRGREASSS